MSSLIKKVMSEIHVYLHKNLLVYTPASCAHAAKFFFSYPKKKLKRLLTVHQEDNDKNVLKMVHARKSIQIILRISNCKKGKKYLK